MAQDMLAELQKRVDAKLRAAPEGSPLKVIDPATWVLLLTTVVDLLKTCMAARGTGVSKTDGRKVLLSELKSPRIIQRIRLQTAVMRQLGGRGKDKRQQAEAIVAAMFAVSAEAKAEEHEALLNEVL